MIRYKFVFRSRSGKGPTKTVTVELPRPEWWKDSTTQERRRIERKAMLSETVQDQFGAGLMMVEVLRPRCECIVQAVRHRDPEWEGANGSCRRCGGPLPRKGEKGWVS